MHSQSEHDLPDSTRYQVLKLLQQEPEISQRELAARMGVSVGKTNYCLRALKDKGLIKAKRFRNAKNRSAYAYILTPKGAEEKAKVTYRFLKRKMREYEKIQREIEELQQEIAE